MDHHLDDRWIPSHNFHYLIDFVPKVRKDIDKYVEFWDFHPDESWKGHGLIHDHPSKSVSILSNCYIHPNRWICSTNYPSEGSNKSTKKKSKKCT